MKKILIVGDSFVGDIDNYEYYGVDTYAHYVIKNYKGHSTMLGIPGSGNDCIANTVLTHFEKYNLIIINWSSTCRYDILLTDKKLIKLFKNQATANKIIDNAFWLFSGGWRGFWSRESAKYIFESLYKYHFQIEDSWRRTLEKILLVQKLLDQHNKKHLHIFSYDTFESQSFGDYEKEFQPKRIYNKQKWQKFSQTQHITKLIDWNKIWFHKNQYSNTGGIMDWCHDYTSDTGHHPTTVGHQQFYQSIIKPWLEQHN